MYDNFEDNNDIGSYGVYDNSVSTQEMQAGSDETSLDFVVGDSAPDNADFDDSLSIFQVDDNGYLLVKDTELYDLITEFKDVFETSETDFLSAVNNLDKDIRILTGVVLVFAFGFFMRLLVRRIFGRWLN